MFYHLLALAVVAIWGVTFISTKVLVLAGLEPVWIFAIRFVLAYAGLLLFSVYRGRRLKFFAKSLHDEIIFVLLGLTGGSLYFLTENTAISYTQTTNVSFLVSITPIVTCLAAIVASKLFKTRMPDLSRFFVIGSALALAGIIMVIFDGSRPELSPAGDMLAIGASLCWAVYSVSMGFLRENYGSVFVTRKVFFYGLLTVIPFLACSDLPPVHVLSRPEVWLNLLFLSLVASLFCFVAWNRVLAELGSVAPTNYLYLNPFFTMVTAVIILGETVTLKSAVGSVAIVVGVAVSQMRKKLN